MPEARGGPETSGFFLFMAKRKLNSGTWIERDLFQSKAFLSLTGFAPQLLILFLSKRHFERSGRKGKEKLSCMNCNRLTVTYAELKALGVTHQRAARGYDELLAKGFLEQIHPGGAYRQDKAVYALVDKWRLWSKGTVFEQRKRDVRRGFQGQRVNSQRTKTAPYTRTKTAP